MARSYSFQAINSTLSLECPTLEFPHARGFSTQVVLVWGKDTSPPQSASGDLVSLAQQTFSATPRNFRGYGKNNHAGVQRVLHPLRPKPVSSSSQRALREVQDGQGFSLGMSRGIDIEKCAGPVFQRHDSPLQQVVICLTTQAGLS